MDEGILKEYAKLIRLPSSFGLSVIAVIGALSVKGNNLELLTLILLLVMGVLFNIFGFVLNDYMDVDIDRRSKDLIERPLVKKTITKKSALMIVITCLITMYIITLIFFSRVLPISMLTISIIFAIFYDTFSKKIPGSEVFLSGAMASICFFGAIAVSDNLRSIKDVGNLTFIIVAIMFLYIFIMNVLEGNLKDVENDRKSGAKTLPIYLGAKTTKKVYIPVSFKLLIISLKSILIILIFFPFIFLNFSFWYWQITLLIALTFGMFWFMMKMLNEPLFNKEKFVLIGRKHGILSYFVFPIILMRVIGGGWMIFLIFYPVIWPLFFNYILYGRSLMPAAYTK